MNKKLHSRLTGPFLLVVSLLFSSIALAAEKPAEEEPEPIPQARSFVTQHSGKFNGQLIRYTATAGETYLRDKEGEPKATIFSFSYIKNDVSKDETRPVTFIWNGGPGSASLWLHMGTFGPRRISVPSDASHPGSPPFDIVEVPETILDVTDMVFIDPVGTGFSNALGKHENKEF